MKTLRLLLQRLKLVSDAQRVVLCYLLGVPKARRLILFLMKPHAFCSICTGNVGFSSEISPSCPEENGSVEEIYF